MKEKVILAYSGGLDTTAIIPWLKETYDYDVVCCCIDCGQGKELEGLEERAQYSGASKLYIEDICDEFAEDYIIPCVQAGAVYENKYLLGTAMARPGIAKKLVEIARKEGAVAICHGATGKGNDQIRFELSIKALAPDIKIIAPWRDPKWTIDSREGEVEYCKAHDILPIAFSPMGSPCRPERDTEEGDVVTFELPELMEIAKAHHCHPALICMKWAVQRGHVPIPFSIYENEYIGNLKTVTEDFLTDEEMEVLRRADKNTRLIKGKVFLWEGAKDWRDIWDRED